MRHPERQSRMFHQSPNLQIRSRSAEAACDLIACISYRFELTLLPAGARSKYRLTRLGTAYGRTEANVSYF